MNKSLALAIILMTALTPMAHAKGKKSKPNPVVTVAPAPTPAPAPSTTTTTNNFLQQQIAKAQSRPQLHPLASCTYCAAYAASQGDFATVDAIGGTTP